MNTWNVGRQAGVEINCNINPRFTLTPFVKYYNKRQRIEQREFFGYLNDESYTWRRYTYECVDIGLMVKYRVTPNTLAVGGASYSIATNNRIDGGYHFYGDNLKTVHLGQIGFKFTPDDILTKASTFNYLIGIRRVSTIKKIGVFEYSLLFYIPTSRMPTYEYEQILVTDDNGTIQTNVSYDSKMYSVETSIVYYLFNLDDKFRVTHSKKSTSAYNK